MNRHILFLTCVMLIHTCLFAQSNPFITDTNGRPLNWTTNYVAEGSPYLHNDYQWADITVSSGKVYKDVRVKYNMIEHQLQYLLDDGTEMITTTPIQSVRFASLPTEDGVLLNVRLLSSEGVINAPTATIFRLIDSGRVSLAKKISITFRDDKKYGEAVITRYFERKESDYIIKDGEYVKLEKNRSFITMLLKDKIKEINSFIDKNNLSCKSMKDIQSVIRHYNSIVV